MCVCVYACACGVSVCDLCADLYVCVCVWGGGGGRWMWVGRWWVWWVLSMLPVPLCFLLGFVPVLPSARPARSGWTPTRRRSVLMCVCFGSLCTEDMCLSV